MPRLILVSHHLCPYVQRAAIALAEKRVPFERRYVDLSEKPDWFLELSPLGKVPLLQVTPSGEAGTPSPGTSAIIFESAVILEYLEETQPHPLHPAEPLERARHRSWIEFGSAVLNAIARFYNARTHDALQAEARVLSALFGRIEAELAGGPWFAGDSFSLVDAVYGPVFRYFDVFDSLEDFEIMTDKPKLAQWRKALASRPSIQNAVASDYLERLLRFLANRSSALSPRAAALL